MVGNSNRMRCSRSWTSRVSRTVPREDADNRRSEHDQCKQDWMRSATSLKEEGSAQAGCEADARPEKLLSPKLLKRRATAEHVEPASDRRGAAHPAVEQAYAVGDQRRSDPFERGEWSSRALLREEARRATRIAQIGTDPVLQGGPAHHRQAGEGKCRARVNAPPAGARERRMRESARVRPR